MSSQERDDMVWMALVATAKDVAPEISVELLQRAYEIQKKHQFSHDNVESIQLMEKLIDDEVGGAS